MKLLQKIRVTTNNGKKTKEELIGKPRPVVDNVAEVLLDRSEKNTSEKELKKIIGIKTIDTWQEVKTIQKVNAIDLEKIKKSELLKYIEDNNIQLTDGFKDLGIKELRELVQKNGI